jgi:hypothetical protein
MVNFLEAAVKINHYLNMTSIRRPNFKRFIIGCNALPAGIVEDSCFFLCRKNKENKMSTDLVDYKNDNIFASSNYKRHN